MDRKEYNNIVGKCADAVYRFILRSCQNKVMAEDIVQESFLTLWENLTKVEYDKAKSFLFTTAYRKMIDSLRRETKSIDIEDTRLGDAITEMQAIDLQEVLTQALNKLPTIQKTVVLLRDYENYSYNEIAEITELTETQVKVYIFRARHSMKSYIGSIGLVI